MARPAGGLDKLQPALENVGPCMSDHVGAQVASPCCKRSIEDSQRYDDHHLLPALVCVEQPKHESLQKDGCNHATSRGAELLLQVATEKRSLGTCLPRPTAQSIGKRPPSRTADGMQSWASGSDLRLGEPAAPSIPRRPRKGSRWPRPWPGCASWSSDRLSECASCRPGTALRPTPKPPFPIGRKS